MDIEVLPQIELGNISRLRIGDFLNRVIANDSYHQFRFAVAYMRMSGLDRLGASIETLLNRGGQVAGAVGIDDRVTSIEALEALSRISSSSTIFYTVSGFIYHPKLYLINGMDSAVIVVGSANLTRNGLFRNIELATAIRLDLNNSEDLSLYEKYDGFINELLNTTNPNVQPIAATVIQTLASNEIIKVEALTEEPGPPLYSQRKKQTASAGITSLFPSMKVPVAPPTLRGIHNRSASPTSAHAVPASQIAPMESTKAFIMHLSAFDSSHTSDVSGTPEILIPNAAVNFFPPVSAGGRKYLDAYFEAALNTGTGHERHSYRFWLYPRRTENRLRLDHATVDLMDPTGENLIVINKLSAPVNNGILYEVTILPQADPDFNKFFSLCTRESQGKKWGMVE